MNILLESRVFYPSIGGLETVSRQLAEAWIARGHNVQVFTQTDLDKADPLVKFPVKRKPSLSEWKKALKSADIFVQSGISLKSLPLGLLSGKPIAFIHHNMLPVTNDSTGFRMFLKKWATYMGYNIAVSKAVAKDIPSPKKTVIPNPYKPEFSIRKTKSDPCNLLFVGRLVSVKGLDLAIRALPKLPSQFSLTVCGDGPDKEKNRQLARTLGVSGRVAFKGWVQHRELLNIAGEMTIQLIPSRYESFGIVALEAIACHCVPVGSKTGGLPEAIGPCGLLVEPDDVDALVRGIKQAVERRDELMRHREVHLQKFQIDNIAQQYLDVFKELCA